MKQNCVLFSKGKNIENIRTIYFTQSEGFEPPLPYGISVTSVFQIKSIELSEDGLTFFGQLALSFRKRKGSLKPSAFGLSANSAVRLRKRFFLKVT
jgi:hypothetical protein